MPYYESVFIARQDISATQADALADSFKHIVEDGGGQVTKKEYWGLRNLTYRIKKNRKGHYVLFNIDGPPVAVLEMERQMRINEDVIRYLTLRVDELEAEDSIVLRCYGYGTRFTADGLYRYYIQSGDKFHAWLRFAGIDSVRDMLDSSTRTGIRGFRELTRSPEEALEQAQSRREPKQRERGSGRGG